MLAKRERSEDSENNRVKEKRTEATGSYRPNYYSSVMIGEGPWFTAGGEKYYSQR